MSFVHVVLFVSCVSDIFTLATAALAENTKTLTGKDLVNLSREKAAGIKTLVLHDVHSYHVPDGTFSKFTNLENLEIRSKNIFTITTHMFTGLVSLRNLKMQHGVINTIEDFAFGDLGKLTKLDLEKNSIPSVGENTLRGLSSLVDLNLAECRISEIDGGAFADLHLVRKLNLYLDNLAEIKPKWWTTMASLEELIIGGNLQQAPDGAFSGLVHLQKLQIEWAKMNTIRSNVLIGLSSLKSLLLRRNQIVTIEAGAFRELGELEILDLFANQIDSIHPDMWLGLDSLKKLQLEYNNIKAIPVEGFFHLPKLETLVLSRNFELESFTMNTFDPQYFEDGHPKDLTLGLGKLALVCDENLCWLKKGEEEGWIDWLKRSRPSCLDRINC